jgi:hypothetical protein
MLGMAAAFLRMTRHRAVLAGGLMTHPMNMICRHIHFVAWFIHLVVFQCSRPPLLCIKGHGQH